MKTKIYNILTIILLISVIIQAPVMYYSSFGLVFIIMMLYIAVGVIITYFLLIVALSDNGKERPKFHITRVVLIILIGTLTLFWGPDLIEKIDWYLRKDTRKKIVHKAMSGELTQNVTDSKITCKLNSWKFPPISNGGNEISIYKYPDNKYKIEFYISHGFSDGYSAFVYTNDPKEIKELDEKTLSQSIMQTNKKLEENWYRVSY